MMTAAQVLAENNFGDTRTGGLAGPMGLFMIVVLAIATVLLIRNMNARLRRLPDQFPQERTGENAETDPPGVGPAGSGAGGPDAATTVRTGSGSAGPDTGTTVGTSAPEESAGSAPNTPHLDRNSQSAP